MNSTLHRVRARARFSAAWYLVPLTIAALTVITAFAVQGLEMHPLQEQADAEPRIEPARESADGA